jgi:hypothetical protein
MINYTHLSQLVKAMPSGSTQWQAIANRLIELWLTEYHRGTPDAEVVETQSQGFSYLFDIAHERLIAAWGTSNGRNPEARDAARMAGHPLSAGREYHRGHAIAHTLGGGTDINLVPQLAKINIGAFRPLEKRAVATPGSFYFTYWSYFSSATDTQLPSGVDQGLLRAGEPPDIRHHGN